MKRLSGKSIIITGGSGLLGCSLAGKLLEEGARVFACDTNAAGVKKAASESGFDYVVLDITDEAAIAKAVEEILAKTEAIHGVVNCAYPRNANYGSKCEDVGFTDVCENVGWHLGGYFLVSKVFADYFKKAGGGDVINISSIYGVVPPRFEIYEGTDMTMPVEYAMTKAAIIHMTKYLAKYYRGHGIRFNCVSPGGLFNGQPEAFVQNYRRFCMNKGMLDVEDVVGAIIFLLTDDARFLNGHNLVVDDGFCL